MIDRSTLPLRRVVLGFVVGLLFAGPAAAGRRDALELRHVALELPGMPAKLLAPDLDGDGRRDLLVVIVFDEAETIVEERVEDLVSVTTVIPAILERRELHAWLADAAGGFRLAGSATLPTSVLTLDVIDGGRSVVALTDAGVARVRWQIDADPTLTIEPWIEDPPAFAGAESFLAELDWIVDLDGDGSDALLVPARDGIALYRRATDDAGAPREVIRLKLPGDRLQRGHHARRDYPWPRWTDVDGDGLDDLVVADEYVHVLLRRDDRFVPPYDAPDACSGTSTALRRHTPEGTVEPVRELAFLGDLDAAGSAEAVMTDLRARDGGMRADLKDAKRPRVEYRIFRLGADLMLEAAPYQTFVAPGHGFDIGQDGPASLSRFEDLDGDGRVDLTTVTLDFSMLQMLRVLATKRIGVGLEFHLWTQDEQGRFAEVEGLDLKEKLRFDLGNVQLARFAQFAGDFDGDGRQEFVHLGRGRVVTIHRGVAGCRYPAQPDLALALEQAPQHVGLVRIADFDGDDRADLTVSRVADDGGRDGTAPVIVDLYLSRRPE